MSTPAAPVPGPPGAGTEPRGADDPTAAPALPSDLAPAAASAAPAVPGAPVVKQTERPHPLTPFIRGWIVLVAIAVTWSRELVPDGSGDGFDLSDLAVLLPLAGVVVLMAGVVGFLSWYFTRFVIDADELRVETGALFKSSKRIPFERLQSVDVIQPLAARLFGLAELRIEVGAGDSTVRLRYLGRAKAGQLREYLLLRAHGRRGRLDDPELALPASAFVDRGAADRPLVTVSPQRLVLSFLASTEWLMTAGLTAAVLVVTGVFDVTAYALPGLIPLLIGTVSVVGRRVFAMFNFTLSESPRGLRVTRGLTNLTSQSVPVDRIQGVRTSQPLLWRPFGWYRVDVDIVGYAGSDGENNESAATSVLLPVATRAEVDRALGRVLPGVQLDALELRPSPRRARWVAWFDFWTLRHGWDERVLVTQHGWLTTVQDVLPHAKTQSVRIEQGPLQRRLRLADVHCDTPRGPVDVVARQLDVAVARELALSQLDRARHARAADRERRALADGPLDELAGEAEVLAAFGTDRDRLLGAGSESEVFALDEGRVLRLYRTRHEAPRQTATQLQALYRHWSGVDVGIEVPLTLQTGELAGRAWSVDRRFSGRNFSGWLAESGPDERRPALLSLLDATTAVARLPSPVPGWARLVGPDGPRTHASLPALLNAMLAGPVARSRPHLQADLPEVAAVWDRLQADLAARRVAPAVVHGDICPPNAFVSLGPSGPVVTGLGDFSPHTVHGDPVADLVGATAFLELEGYDGAAEDAAWLTDVVLQRYGTSPVAEGDLARWLGVYRRFYGFYFSDSAAFDPHLYAWCLRQLRG
ncbi:putative membrane protein [Friedmanniella luteola]|uniref:Putative membrane protein n=1 Tax=Friedmanniella luteola TaxID=546871 RepID=A0A1H1ZWE5_9ACTN|nr:PH domain-containing protein [Friedmanniella luteola]SDT38058.1 putative membrane protein [Friedmanniella luteola]